MGDWAKTGKTRDSYVMDREHVDAMRDDLITMTRSALGIQGGSGNGD